VDCYWWNLAVHRSSSAFPMRTLFPPGRRTSSCSYRLLVRSADVRFVRHLSAATGRHLDPSFFVRTGWCCSIGVGSSHVDICHVNSTGKFGSPDLVRHRSHLMLHGVLLPRCTKLLLVVGSPHVSPFVASLWSGSGVSLGNVFDVVPESPSSV